MCVGPTADSPLNGKIRKAILYCIHSYARFPAPIFILILIMHTQQFLPKDTNRLAKLFNSPRDFINSFEKIIISALRIVQEKTINILQSLGLKMFAVVRFFIDLLP